MSLKQIIKEEYKKLLKEQEEEIPKMLKVKKIHGDFYCDYNDLENLVGAPLEVTGDFHCEYNSSMIAPEGAPKKIDGKFVCYKNNLETLEGLENTTILGDFWCNSNNLYSLKGAPKEVGGRFICSNNPKKFTEDEVKSVSNVKGKIRR